MSDLSYLLEENHKDLFQWFLFHQESLLLNHIENTEKSFKAFEETLLCHIAFENTFLLDCLEINQVELRWQLTIYRKEHEKIEKMLRQLDLKLQDYAQLSGRKKRLALLEVLDAEQTFRHVIEHHEQREEMDLFKKLIHCNTEIAIAEWLAIQKNLTEKYSQLRNDLKNFLDNETRHFQ